MSTVKPSFWRTLDEPDTLGGSEGVPVSYLPKVGDIVVAFDVPAENKLKTMLFTEDGDWVPGAKLKTYNTHKTQDGKVINYRLDREKDFLDIGIEETPKHIHQFVFAPIDIALLNQRAEFQGDQKLPALHSANSRDVALILLETFYGRSQAELEEMGVARWQWSN